MIKMSKADLDENELEIIKSVLDDGYLGMGAFTRRFEDELRTYLSTDVACVSNGTSALQLALEAVGVKEGDEVLVPSLTFVATFQAISATGAKPIACDIKEGTFTLCVDDLKKRLTPQTKAIVFVHFASSDETLKDVRTFAKEHNLRLIEDAAHSFGCIGEDNKPIGASGDVVCFSFGSIKNLTCGEGGAVVSADQSVMNYVKDARLLGVEKDTEKRYKSERSWDFDVTHQGWRYHMGNLNAGIGLAQLKKLPGFIQKRKEIAEFYTQNLKKITGITLVDIGYSRIGPHIFCILSQNRDALRDHLTKAGIETGIHYKPNHLLSFYKTPYALPVTEKIYNQIITIPCQTTLTQKDLDYIVHSIASFS